MVSVSSIVKDSIQILFHGNTVSNVQLLQIRIKNTGILDIKPEDYVEPLAIEYPDTVRILSSEIIDSRSLGIKIEEEFSNQSRIVFSKTLLNKKDYFDVKILLSDGDTNFSVKGRIVGISKIRPTGISKLYNTFFAFLEFTIVYLVVFMFAPIFARAINQPEYTFFIQWFLGGLIIIGWVFVMGNSGRYRSR